MTRDDEETPSGLLVGDRVAPRALFQTRVALAFSPDGATLACGYEDGAVRLWDVATGRQRAVQPGTGLAPRVWSGGVPSRKPWF
jgi:WD40 repeat protein